jgi:hypothetical protein
MRLLGRSFGEENVNKAFYRFASVSELRRFYVGVDFNVAIVNLKKCIKMCLTQYFNRVALKE